MVWIGHLRMEPIDLWREAHGTHYITRRSVGRFTGAAVTRFMCTAANYSNPITLKSARVHKL